MSHSSNVYPLGQAGGSDASAGQAQIGPISVVLRYDEPNRRTKENEMGKGLFRRTGVRYEVACDVLGGLIAHHAEIIGTQLSRDEPDQAVVEAAELAQRSLRDEREALDPRDPDAIEKVIATYGPQARAAYQ